MNIVYPLLAYGILGLALFIIVWEKNQYRLTHNIPKKLHAIFYCQHTIIILGLLLSIFLVASFYKILYGVFYQPAVLTVLLALCVVVNFYTKAKTAIQQKAIRVLVGFSSLLCVMSLGFWLDGANVYHQHFDGFSIAGQYVIFMAMFVIGYIFDKKVMLLAWGCLLAFLANVMYSPFILDYVADFWLFAYGVCLCIQYLYRLGQKQIQKHRKI